jgi:hypothetical protein
MLFLTPCVQAFHLDHPELISYARRLDDKAAAGAKNKECAALYARLAELDPMHGKFYARQIEQLEKILQ